MGYWVGIWIIIATVFIVKQFRKPKGYYDSHDIGGYK